jgi:hypothetical protein
LPVAHQLGLASFFSDEEIIRSWTMQSEERTKRMQAYKANKPGLDLSKEVMDKWSNFAITIDQAHAKIQTILADSFQSLAPKLKEASASLSELVQNIMASQVVKDGLDQINQALKHVADWLGTQEAEDDVKQFMAAIDRFLPMAKKIMKIVYEFSMIGVDIWNFSVVSVDVIKQLISALAAKGLMTTEKMLGLSTKGLGQMLGGGGEVTGDGLADTDKAPAASAPSPIPPGYGPDAPPWRRRIQSNRPGRPHSATPGYMPDTKEIMQTDPTGLSQPGPAPDAPIDWRPGARPVPGRPLRPETIVAINKLHSLYGGYMINSSTGGGHVAYSQHWLGKAIDIAARGMSDKDYSRLITDAALSGFTRFGFSASHLHADMGDPGKGHTIFTFIDPEEGVSYRAGRTYKEWQDYLEGVVAKARERKTSLLDHLPDVARQPKAVIVKNHTDSSTRISVSRTAFA